MQNFVTILAGLRILMAAIGFWLVFRPVLSGRMTEAILLAAEEAGRNLKENGRGIFDYEKADRYLIRNGAKYHFGGWVNPFSFMAARLILGAAGAGIGLYYGLLQACILAVLFFLIPDGLLSRMNHQDNEKILPELKLVYNAMALQIQAGVYVMDAMAECYGSVCDKRLKQGLLSLSGEIAMKADAQKALERFQDKFDNRYIDSLCITVLQALESGQAVELLVDIAEQMKDMEAGIMSRKKAGLDRSITFYQLGILTAILAVVLYACITHMFSAAINF